MNSYRQQRDLLLKNSSMEQLLDTLVEVARASGVLLACHRGRPCKIDKVKLACYVLLRRQFKASYETMERESKLYLGTSYDHSTLHYHYTMLDPQLIQLLTHSLRGLCESYLPDIIIHIADSTALSTTVGVERVHGGQRRKELLTQKYHTLLGYDLTHQCVVVEGQLATDHHVSDSQGCLQLLHNNLNGYLFGDPAFETYELTARAEELGLTPVIKPTKKSLARTLTPKGRYRQHWEQGTTLPRLYKAIRGVGEVLYGGATRAGLLHSHSRRTDNQRKDELLIGLKQNILTYLRLKVLLQRIFRETDAGRYLYKRAGVSHHL